MPEKTLNGIVTAFFYTIVLLWPMLAGVIIAISGVFSYELTGTILNFIPIIQVGNIAAVIFSLFYCDPISPFDTRRG